MTSQRGFERSVLAASWILTLVLGPGLARADSAGALIAGGEHTCLLTPEGVAHCWGSNEFGALLARETASLCGTKRRPAACVRQPVVLGEGLGWTDLAVGMDTLCALDRQGRVSCWGRDWLGTLGRGDDPLEQCTYDLGEARDCSLDLETGQVHCVDLGNHEQRTAPCGRTPAPVQGLPTALEVEAVGPAFCALTPTPYCWGADEGDVIEGSGKCNEYYACVRTAHALPVEGTVSALGHRFMTAQMSDGTLVKIEEGGKTAPKHDLSGVTSFADTRNGGCAVTGQERSVHCWGQGADGLLGAGPMEADRFGAVKAWTPVQVLGLTQVKKIALDPLGSHACALLDDLTLWCWGNNTQGQLGLGDTEDRWQPVQVPGLGEVVDVAAGSLHTCALNQAGEVHCWGADHLGQVGTSDHSCPLDYIFDPGPTPCQLTPARSYPR